MKAFLDACHLNPEVFHNKVVMDIGCGTGILSIFAARAGAKKVYGIDSANIIEATQYIVNTNGFGNVIKLIHKKVEDVTEKDIQEGKVDIIIS